MIQSPSIERLKTTPKDKGMKSVSIKKERQKNTLEEADKVYKFFF